MENNKNNNKGLIILIVIFSLIVLALGGWMVYDKFINKDEPKPIEKDDNIKDNNEKDNEEISFGLVEYGVLSFEEVKPFKSLNFSKKVMATSDEEQNIKVNNNTIKYIFSEDEEVVSEIKVNNLKQVGLACNCGGCYAIYYLSGNDLYQISLDHGELLKDDDGTYKSSTKLVSNNINSFTLFEVGIIESTTCGGEDLIVKYNNGDTKVIDVDLITGEVVGKYDLNSLERYWVSDIGDENELFVVSRNAKVKNYLVDENKNKMIAKKILISNVDEGEKIKYITYVLNDKDILYVYEDYTKLVGKPYNNSKVKAITMNDEKANIEYEDGRKESIDAQLTYDYSKPFKRD